jgi:hypothetical protein
MPALRKRFAAKWIVATLVAVVLVVQTARFARRPYPTYWISSAAYYVFWSDSTMTAVHFGPRSLEMWGLGAVTLVRWPDGKFSAYLHVP